MEKIYYLFLTILIIIGLSFIIGNFFYSSAVVVPLKAYTEKIILPSSTSEQLGQNFIVGIEGKILDNHTEKILEKIKPAGIVLYYRNFQNPDQFKKLISELQSLALRTTNHPYFIMIDEEPGGATRLDLFNNVFAFGTPNWVQIEKDIKIMRELGINVDLAPIADFAFDSNTFIRDRIPANDINHLIDFNKKFIALLNQNHILATLKHFPGMGVFVDDPHKTLPYTNLKESIISKSIEIFKDGIDNGADLVMTCHGVYDDIDPYNPATLSKKITTNILRNQVGFNGIAITDDLADMPFTIGKTIDLSEAVVQAIKAGHNLVLFSHRPEDTEIIFNKLISVVEKDVELKSIIGQNYIKVVSLKNDKLN